MNEENGNRIDFGGFHYSQVAELQAAADDGLNIDQIGMIANHAFGADEMKEIRLGFEHGLTEEQIAVYAKAEFRAAQMFEVREGLEHGLPVEWVKSYADPRCSEYDMRRSRYDLENKLKLQNDVPAPGYSPWGAIQSCQEHCSGVFEVSTANHGGVMARMDMAKNIFSGDALLHGAFFEAGWYCFEEGCCAAVAYRELMDKHLLKLPKDVDVKKFEKEVNDTLRQSVPEYWRVYQKNKEKSEFER